MAKRKGEDVEARSKAARTEPKESAEESEESLAVKHQEKESSDKDAVATSSTSEKITEPLKKTRLDQAIEKFLPAFKELHKITNMTEIKSGSYGRVFVAQQENQEVAIKLQFKNEEADFEVQSMKSMKHRNIVTFLGSYESKENPALTAIFMKRYQESLHDVIVRGAMEEEKAKKVFTEIMNGVAYLHLEKQISHNDLKLDNILMDKGEPVIADFGLSAKISGNLTNELRGTPCYLAPEALMGKFYDPVKSDIYALGCILFLMLTGTYPFNFDSNEDNFGKDSELYDNVTKGRRNDIEVKLSTEVNDLINRMLQRYPAKRINLQGVIDHPWLKVESAK